jgi:hypothetical protein
MSELTKKIRSRGYWHVQIRPTTFEEKRVKTLAELERAFDSARVELRGWDYPHAPREGPTRHADYIQGAVDWERHMELWRLYQSGQFVHLFAMYEDWTDDPNGRYSHVLQAGQLLEVSSTLWTMTEIFLFAARLAEAIKIVPDVTVSYRLHRLNGRQLQTLDPRRVELGPYRKASSELSDYGNTRTLRVTELIASAADLAIDETLALYERFNWNPARQQVVDDQRKLIERRL